MDGLPGMKRALAAGKREKVAPIKKMVGPLTPTRYQNGLGFSPNQVIVTALLSVLFGVLLALYGPLLLAHRDLLDLDMLKGMIQPLSH